MAKKKTKFTDEDKAAASAAVSTISEKQRAHADPTDAEQEEDIATARRIWEFPELEDILPELCVEYREIVDKQNALEKRRKELSSEIMPLLEAVEQDAIAGDEWVAVNARGRKRTLSPTLLVMNGVDADIINRSYTEVKYRYIQVRKPTRREYESQQGEGE